MVYILKNGMIKANALIIWRNLIKVYPILSKKLSWRIGCGSHMVLGIDIFIGEEGKYSLSSSLISVLNKKNV